MSDKKFFHAMNQNIFCEEIKKENKVGTLYVPDSIDLDFTYAEIISCENGFFDNGTFIPTGLQPGDIIAFPKVCGTKITLNGRNMIRVFFKDIFAKEVDGEIVDDENKE